MRNFRKNRTCGIQRATVLIAHQNRSSAKREKTVRVFQLIVQKNRVGNVAAAFSKAALYAPS